MGGVKKEKEGHLIRGRCPLKSSFSQPLTHLR